VNTESGPEYIRLPWLLKSVRHLEFPHKLGLCDRLFGRRLAAEGVCWVDTAASVPWKLDLVNSTHRWIVYGKYEGSGFLEWAKAFLPPSGVVVDSGANIGQMSLYLAQWVPEGRVLAFEPGKAQADWLEECLAVNPSLSVEVVRLALGANTSDLCLTNAGVPTNHGTQNYVSATGGAPVHVVRLSDEIGRRGIKEVDLWKLDVEGYEFEALQGAERLLKDRLIRALYIEIQDCHQAQIIGFLNSFGYGSYSLSWRGIPTPANTFADFGMGLFLPN
jgi:FkbM family methyltransferase